MSGRLATQSPKRQTPAFAAFVALCAGAMGVGVAVAGFGGQALAQPAHPPTKNELKPVDRENPVPADAPRRQSPAKFAIPNPDRLIFAKIEDFKPVASEAENPEEYLAWCEFVTHAKQFATADLEQAAARDLTPLDLIKPNRSLYRRELLRFEGKSVCARRLPAPKFFQDNPNLGVKELYEVRLVPTDESPLTPVSIVFTELPEGLAAVKQKGEKEWLDVDAWVTATGFFFKTISVPGEKASSVVCVPVLVGKSVTVLPGPPAPARSGSLLPGQTGPTDDNPTAMDKNTRVYKFIRDKTKLPPRPRLMEFDAPWEEIAAYDRVVRHAARFSAAELEEHARADLKFADVFLDESHSGYRLDLIKFEGRLISLRRDNPPEILKASGVEHMFEGWLVPANEPRGNPICILFTEPLEGVEATGRVNKWISFAGYYFKKLRYQSAEQDPNNPNKNVDKYAPLLIGKSPIARPERDPDRPSQWTWGGFVLAAIFAGVALILAAGGLTWYYRSGDRKAKESMDAVRHRNPFDGGNTAPPPA